MKKPGKGLKKIISTGCSILLIASLITACSSSPKDAGNTESTTSDTQKMQAPPNGSMSGSETGSVQLTGVYSIDGTDETSADKDYNATAENQSAILLQNGGNLTISNSDISKAGDTTNTDESNFYGLNSIVAVTKGSTMTINGSTLTSDSEGSNALFSTGKNSIIIASNVKIKTSGNSSRGLDATYGGTIMADKMDITTTGAHCAPIATDRGEGNIVVSNSKVSASGDGSPCIYSTGDIKATNLTGTASGSQTAVIEGKNSIELTNCNLTGAGKNGVMLYQSTSGDANAGTSVFTSNGSTITTNSDGEMFYVTNTDAVVNLTNTVLNFKSKTLLNAAGNNTNNWEKSGSNGGNVVLNAVKQTLKGSILCDNISTAEINLTDGSKYEGAIDSKNEGDVDITLDAASSWTLNGDSYVTIIKDADESFSNIISNGKNIYYDASNSANSYLNGKTIALSGGGSIMPMK